MSLRPFASVLALLTLPGVALAHPEPSEAASFMSGLLHPLTGADHLLALLGVGIWAALQSNAFLKWAIPSLFLVSLLVGFQSGAQHLSDPYLETELALSVVALGVMLALRARWVPVVALGVAAAFAWVHGYAHGIESVGNLMNFGLGFLLISGGLNLLGLFLGARLHNMQPTATRALGGLMAACGVLMMV